MATYIPCPHCGADIRADARFCRHCGSSNADGWRDDEEYDSDVDEFDYDEFVEREFSDRSTATEIRPLWRLVAVILLIVFLGGSLVFLL